MDRATWNGAGGPSSLTGLAAPATSLTIALAWVLLATWRPTSTYHFAPLLVSVAWAYAARLQRGRALTRSESTLAVVGGAAISLITTAALVVTDKMAGPTLWESSDAPLEAVLMTALGGLWALRVATKRRGGFLVPNAEPLDQER